jgi:hypothetical protein
VVLVGLLLLGLLGQSLWVFYRERKTQVTLSFDAALIPRGQGAGEVTGCRHMASGPTGDLYYLQGVGEGSQLQRFGRDGKLLARLAPDAPAKERLNNAFAVAGLADGGAWVVERGSGRLRHYNAKLRLLEDYSAPQSDLTGVAVAPDGTVWAASFAGTLFSLAPGSRDLKPFTGSKQGRLVAPFRLCFDGDGNLYVLDFVGGIGQDPAIKVYGPKGDFLRSWTVKNQPVNEFMCIAFHPRGYVVLNDTRSEVVDAVGFRLYSPQGKLKGMATLTNHGQNIRAIPGFAINPSGDWFLDMTPLQQGCGRLSWMQEL